MISRVSHLQTKRRLKTERLLKNLSLLKSLHLLSGRLPLKNLSPKRTLKITLPRNIALLKSSLTRNLPRRNSLNPLLEGHLNPPKNLSRDQWRRSQQKEDQWRSSQWSKEPTKLKEQSCLKTQNLKKVKRSARPHPLLFKKSV